MARLQEIDGNDVSRSQSYAGLLLMSHIFDGVPSFIMAIPNRARNAPMLASFRRWTMRGGLIAIYRNILALWRSTPGAANLRSSRELLQRCNRITRECGCGRVTEARLGPTVGSDERVRLVDLGVLGIAALQALQACRTFVECDRNR